MHCNMQRALKMNYAETQPLKIATRWKLLDIFFTLKTKAMPEIYEVYVRVTCAKT